MGSCLNLLLLFFHWQIWGMYSIVFYSLLSDVVSKPFLKTAVSYLCWLLFPFLVWWGGGCFVFFFSSSFCSSPTKTLGGMKTCWSGNGDILLVKCLMLFPAIPLQLLLVSLLEHLWLFCEHKITGGMSACSPPFPPMVCRHRSLTNTVATAIEFGTRIIYCTKASCICAKRLLRSCFLKAWWLSVFNAVLPLHLGC